MGAIAGGHFDDRIGGKPVIVASLSVLIVVCAGSIGRAWAGGLLDLRTFAGTVRGADAVGRTHPYC